MHYHINQRILPASLTFASSGAFAFRLSCPHAHACDEQAHRASGIEFEIHSCGVRNFSLPANAALPGAIRIPLGCGVHFAGAETFANPADCIIYIPLWLRGESTHAPAD